MPRRGWGMGISRMPARGSGGGGAPLAVEAGGEDYTITGPLHAFTVTIASGPFAGTYPSSGTYDQADFIGQPPLILADPIRTGTLGVGNLQTAVLAPVLYDPGIYGVVHTAKWIKTGVTVSTALTYMQQAGDSDVGVQFEQTSSNSYGSAVRQFDAIPVPAYTPNGIVFVNTGGGRWISRTGGYAAANSDTMFVHLCFRPTAFGPDHLVSSVNESLRISYSATGLGARIESPTNTLISTIDIVPSPSFVVGDTINVLYSVDVRSSLGATSGRRSIHINVNGTTDYSSNATNLSTAELIDMVQNIFFGASPANFNPVDAIYYRLAIWENLTVPDITDSAVRAQFYGALGAPKAIGSANALIGKSPTIKLAETAANVNALVNEGTLSAFTSKSGTFTETGF